MNTLKDISCNYLEILQSHLKIKYSEENAVFYPDLYDEENFPALKKDIQNLFSSPNQLIKIISEDDNITRSCAYGLCDDFNLLLKSGLLIGEQVVLWDIVGTKNRHNRPLKKEHLGLIATNLSNALELIESNQLIILPHPFYWSTKLPNILNRLADNNVANLKTLPLIPSLASALQLGIQPYTITTPLSSLKKEVGHICKPIELLAGGLAGDIIKGIVSGLASSKILQQDNFEKVISAPYSSYISTTDNRKKFFNEFREKLTSGGPNCYGSNWQQFCSEYQQYLTSQKKSISGIATSTAPFLSAGASIGGLIGIFEPTTAIASASLGIIPSLLDLLPSKGKDMTTLTAIFYQLEQN